MNISISLSAEEIEVIAARLFQRELAPLSPRHPTAKEPAKPQKRTDSQSEASSPVVLAPGNVDWRVEIDGVPVRWMLGYTTGNFPADCGNEVIWQDERYRVSRIYGTSLKVTSLDADRYAVQAYGQQGNGAVK